MIPTDMPWGINSSGGAYYNAAGAASGEGAAFTFYHRAATTSLESVPEHAVAAARAWFAEDKEFFEYRGARLLFNLFPMFTPPYERALEGICTNGT